MNKKQIQKEFPGVYQFGVVKPPIDAHLLEFHFPGVQQDRLNNGLTVLLIKRCSLPKVYIRLGIDGGTKYESPDKAGLMQLLASAIKKGTNTRSYREIIDSIEQIGGELDTAVNEDFFVISAEFLKEHLETGLEILRDLILQPSFPEQEVEKERLRQIADLENEKSSPEYLAGRRMDKGLYSPHPYHIHRTLASMKNITREDLFRMQRRQFYPAGAFLVLAGDISDDKMIDRVERYFKEWSVKEPDLEPVKKPAEMKKLLIHIVNRPQSEQSNILLGNLLFPRRHPDFEKMLVMNKILGGGGSGRLFLNLREEKGYTYGAYSSLQTHKDQGTFIANAEVRSEVTADAIRAFQEEFRRIKAEQVTGKELHDATRYLLGIFPLQNETASSIASLALKQKLFGLGEDYWDRYVENIKNVTQQDIQEMAQKYIREDRMMMVIVGDAKKLTDQLADMGEIRIFDLEDQEVSLGQDR
jgi:zinc protease